MIHESKPAKIKESFYCLGPSAVPSYLLDGKHPIIFDAGVYIFGEHYWRESLRLMGERRPEYLFLTHVHFDHCGAAGLLKRFMPGLKIAASAEASDIIKKPSAIKLIKRLNAFDSDGKVHFEPFLVDRVLEDGEIVEVAQNLHVEIIKTPGHTRDMLSFYIPEYKILIPSESVGVPGLGDYIFSEFLTDYHVYLDSLKKLAAYDVEILVLAHGYYYTGDDARNYMPRAIEHTKRFREAIEKLLRNHGDDYDTIASIIKRDEYDPIDGDKQPQEAYLINLHAKIKAVQRIMN
ncbi:MAG TPA: MBL fold metallo-hydrolase [Deltaproteobacteria bacterium]|nr:MBL fold metallo-hydrolase [Deltaproteobacteria bacterium]